MFSQYFNNKSLLQVVVDKYWGPDSTTMNGDSTSNDEYSQSQHAHAAGETWSANAPSRKDTPSRAQFTPSRAESVSRLPMTDQVRFGTTRRTSLQHTTHYVNMLLHMDQLLDVEGDDIDNIDLDGGDQQDCDITDKSPNDI